MKDGESYYKLSKPNCAYLIEKDKPLYHWLDDDDKIVDLLNDLHNVNVKLIREVVDLKLICQRQADFMKKEGYDFKDLLDSIKKDYTDVDVPVQSCSICYFMQLVGEYEELYCGHPHALPENGAPEIISGDPNTCPYFISKEE